MKSILLKGKNKPFIFADSAQPEPDLDDALVQIKAAALNHRDLWIQKGQYAGIKYPVIPGSDGSGIVVSTGGRLNDSWVGKEVILNPSLNWGENEAAQGKQFSILGMPSQGTFAEYISVSGDQLFEKPAHLSFEQAAALPLAGLTAFRVLLRRAALRAGEKLLITGIGGGVAQFVLQFGIQSGAEVYVTSGSDEKIQKAMNQGAAGGANYKKEDWAEKLQKLAGSFDVIIDSAGGEGTGKLIDLAAPGGRIAMYGGSMGMMDGISPQKLFWKQISLLGSTMGSPSDFRAMLHFVNKHKIVPQIDEVFPMSEAQEALEKMEKGDQFGKLVLRMA